ncbi:MAG: hypothetical protein AAFR99_06145, partial [Cyanobacteria bacterium J06629_9]
FEQSVPLFEHREAWLKKWHRLFKSTLKIKRLRDCALGVAICFIEALSNNSAQMLMLERQLGNFMAGFF